LARSKDIGVWIGKKDHITLFRLIERSNAHFSAKNLGHILVCAADAASMKILSAVLNVRPISLAMIQLSLVTAAGGGHLAIVERLLVAGAEVNVAIVGDYGRTTLQAAAEGGHLEVIGRLLTTDAEVNAPAAEYRKTALQAAESGGHLKIVERLVAAGAKVTTHHLDEDWVD
jgi:ankyrin repeat protein